MFRKRDPNSCFNVQINNIAFIMSIYDVKKRDH